MAFAEGASHPLDRPADDMTSPMRGPRLSRNSIVINKQRLQKIRRKLSDPEANNTTKHMFTVKEGDGIYNADAITAARSRAKRRGKGIDSRDDFQDIADAVPQRTGRRGLARDSIVLAHNRLGAPAEGFLLGSPTRAASGDDDGDEAASEMQRLKIIEAARKRAVKHKHHVDSMGGTFDTTAASAGGRSIRSRDSMVLNKVRMTEDSLFNPSSAEDDRALHKGWLIKNPIAERDSIKAKWKVPSGRAKRRWFVLSKNSDRDMPALSYYTDAKETTLKGTLYLDKSWNVQPAKNSSANKHLFELFSDTQGLLVQAENAEEYNVWLHYIQTLLRRLKRVTK